MNLSKVTGCTTNFLFFGFCPKISHGVNFVYKAAGPRNLCEKQLLFERLGTGYRNNQYGQVMVFRCAAPYCPGIKLRIGKFVVHPCLY